MLSRGLARAYDACLATGFESKESFDRALVIMLHAWGGPRARLKMARVWRRWLRGVERARERERAEAARAAQAAATEAAAYVLFLSSLLSCPVLA